MSQPLSQDMQRVPRRQTSEQDKDINQEPIAVPQNPQSKRPRKRHQSILNAVQHSLQSEQLRNESACLKHRGLRP